MEHLTDKPNIIASHPIEGKVRLVESFTTNLFPLTLAKLSMKLGRLMAHSTPDDIIISWMINSMIDVFHRVLFITYLTSGIYGPSINHGRQDRKVEKTTLYFGQNWTFPVAHISLFRKLQNCLSPNPYNQINEDLEIQRFIFKSSLLYWFPPLDIKGLFAPIVQKRQRHSGDASVNAWTGSRTHSMIDSFDTDADVSCEC